jgi:hypothetical protein
VRELTRVAVPDTEGAWLDAARGKTVRQLEELVANKSPGDDPLTPLAPTPRRHVLRFDVAPETFALFRDAMTELRRRAGAALDDDSALLALARQVLGGPEDPGRANYQIALSVCSTCGSARQQGGGELVPVGLHILAMAHCDGQHLGPLEHPANQNASTDANAEANAEAEADPRGKDETTHEVHSIPGAHVGATHEPQGGQADCHSPAIHDPESGLQRGRARAAAGFPAPDAAINSGEAQDKGVDHCRDDVGHARAGASARVQIPNPEPVHVHPRAKQTIPPALRRAVLLRDHGCCRVPGCKNTLYLDLHHIQLRSEGGRHAPENILSVCGVHHRAIHRGELSIQGTATNPTFQHADGSPYGQIDRPHALDAHAKVFSALRGLGFREAQVRVTLAELQRREALRDASAEQLLRAALQLLTRACASVSR